MQDPHPLIKLAEMQKAGHPAAICSVCSAHPMVIEAAVRKCAQDGTIALIESTANQVNQFGGYTGMNPDDFSRFVRTIAKDNHLPDDRLILGGDHLGPLTWQNECEETAMAHAAELVRLSVLAGYTKIHIDTSMHLASDDHSMKLPVGVIAGRAARLAQTAAESFRVLQEDMVHPPVAPVFVIGSEVPVPGGIQDEGAMHITTPGEIAETLAAFKQAFAGRHLDWACSRIIALVAQPGVEFGSHSVHAYDRTAASGLIAWLKRTPALVLEGHSTDYQLTGHLQQMAEDGIAILKVGPALTFALREGLVALEHIEKAVHESSTAVLLSSFSTVLENVMVENPVHWKKYYHGSETDKKNDRLFSLSDRCRYYLSDERVSTAVERLLHNLDGQNIPLPLLSQYLPEQYWRIRANRLPVNSRQILLDKVIAEINRYPSWQPD